MRDYEAAMAETDAEEARRDWWDRFMPDWRDRLAEHDNHS